MPKRTKKSSAGKGVAALLLVSMLGAGGFAAYVRLTPQAAHVTDRRSDGPDVSIQSKPTKREVADTPVEKTDLYVPSVVNNDIKLSSSPAGDPPEGTRPEVFLVNQTLESLKIDGARAVGVDVQNHVAMMDFNPALQKGYGSVEEGYLIKSLQMALGQFKDIKKFQIIIDGKPIDSLGNIDLSAPLDVIRPGATKAPKTDDSEHPKPE